MNLYIGLRPFTKCDPDTLGRRLSGIVCSYPNDQRLSEDFPHVREAYGTPDAAAETIRSRQKEMISEPAYAALAVMLGTSERTALVYGVTTMNVTRPPRLGRKAGPHMAVWLDFNRPKVFRDIGRALMEARIKWLVQHSEFYGRMWTVVRPENKGSWRVWAYSGLSVRFEPTGGLRSYRELDGVATPRQLFVATESIETLRRRC